MVGLKKLNCIVKEGGRVRFVIVYLDNDGLECWREEYSEEEAVMLGYGEIIEEMKKEGRNTKQVGEVIFVLFPK